MKIVYDKKDLKILIEKYDSGDLYALSHIIAYKSRFLGQKNPFFVRLGLQNGAWRSSLRYGRNSAWTYI
jgi:hypothetical protein